MAKEEGDEREEVAAELRKMGYEAMYPPTIADGNCFFHAVAQLWGQQDVNHHHLRKAMCSYVEHGGVVSVFTQNCL